MLYLEEYRKTQISELRTKKSRTKPTPPISSPKDSPSPTTRTRSIIPQNYCNVDRNSHGKSKFTPEAQFSFLLKLIYILGLLTSTGNSKGPSKHSSKTCTPGYQSSSMSSGTILPPELLNEYFNNVDRNSKGMSRSITKTTK